MSQRSRKKKREGKSTPATEPPKDQRKKRRWRVTLLVAVAGVSMLLISLIGGLQPPMLTLYNKTGGQLNDIRISFPGGEGKAAPVPDGGQTTLVLRPSPNAPKPAGPHFIRLDVVMPDGKPIVIKSSALAKDAGSHEVFYARPQATGGYEIVYQGAGGPRFSLRDILRGIGIRL
jgi:hypothetical protein